MKRMAESSWVSPDGLVYPLGGKGHSEFAYEILLNEKLGDNMSKKIPTDGTVEPKGESGDVAKANANKELGGNPQDPKHCEELCGRGWTQAALRSGRLVVKARSMLELRAAWSAISPAFPDVESAAFIIGSFGSGVSAGLCGKDLKDPAEFVLGRVAEMVSWNSTTPGVTWHPLGPGVRYFE